MELHPIIAALDHTYDAVTDIGAAEGYYAVGLAMRLQIPVRAFETDGRERTLMREMASLNGVGKHVIACGFCGRDHLKSLAGRRSLVLSDCEGYERVLFDGETIPCLARADLIIETHGDRTEELLTARFRESHRVDVYRSTSRGGRGFPELSFLSVERADRAISEERPPQSWLWCRSLLTAKSGSRSLRH
jgi:hypothetical protein